MDLRSSWGVQGNNTKPIIPYSLVLYCNLTFLSINCSIFIQFVVFSTICIFCFWTHLSLSDSSFPCMPYRMYGFLSAIIVFSRWSIHRCERAGHISKTSYLQWVSVRSFEIDPKSFLFLQYHLPIGDGYEPFWHILSIFLVFTVRESNFVILLLTFQYSYHPERQRRIWKRSFSGRWCL